MFPSSLRSSISSTLAALGFSVLAATAAHAFPVPTPEQAKGKVQMNSLLDQVSSRYLWGSYDNEDVPASWTRYPYGRYTYPGYHPSPSHGYYPDPYDYPYPYWKWHNPDGYGFNLKEPHAHPRRTSAHVAWCRAHYRSYRAAPNSWVSYSGAVRQCVSPYSH